MWPFKPKLIWHLPEGRAELMPAKATPGSMAYDLISPNGEIIQPGSTSIINTLVAVTIPKGYAMILGSRSGLAANNRTTVEAGWIDCDYRGLIKIVLYNHGCHPLKIEAGQRIAQAMLVKTHKVKEVKSFSYPDTKSTKRGSGGFGSTGK
jgi:dUTP pyrophosphatase